MFKIYVRKILYLYLLLGGLFDPINLFANIENLDLFDWAGKTFSHFKESPSGRVPGDSDTIGFTADILQRLLTQYGQAFKKQNLPDDHLGSYAQKIELPIGSNVILIGDIQGSFHSLMRNFLRLAALGYLDENWKLKDDTYLVFLGDLVGSPGNYQCEVLYSVLRLKLANWDKVFCIKGNMDGSPTSYFSGAVGDFKKGFFQTCPHVLLIKSGNNWVQCSHSAFAEGYSFVNFMSSGDEFCKISQDNTVLRKFEQDNRFTGRSSGGNGFLAKQDVQNYCGSNNIKSIFRGHQDGAFGLKIFFNDSFVKNDPKLQSIQTHIETEKKFSTKNYHSGCGPYRWSTVARAYVNNPLEKITGSQGIFISKCEYPVFTLSTKSEAGNEMNFDCFCILKTAQNYDDWILTPYEFYLGPANQRKNKYVLIQQNGPSQTAGYQDDDPSCVLGIQGIEEKIMVTWVDDFPQLVSQLIDLKIALKGLKNKLSALQFKLSELAKKLTS